MSFIRTAPGQMPVIFPMSNSPVLEAKLDVKPAGTSGQDSNYKVTCNLTNK